MKQDSYTKFVLTLIAICLVVLTLKQVNIFSSANAGPTPFKASDKANYGLVPLNSDGSITVKIAPSSTIDVNIESCSRNAFYYAEPIEVKIKD